MTDWHRVLRAVCPHGRAEILSGFAEALPGLCDEFALNTLLRQAHFIAQCAHESAGLLTATEYASGAAYEHRRDLGNVEPGDGKRFKGRGLIQLTGRANYEKFGGALALDLVGNPELAAEFPAAVQTAALYWKLHGLNSFADHDDIVTITKRINGGLNGLDSRREYLAKAKAAIKAASAAPASPYGALGRVGFMATPDDGSPSEDAVRAAQSRLKALGYFPGDVDGNMGGATRGALAAFQTDSYIPITSDLDEATQAALGSSLARQRPIADARANATVQDLRDAGSETIAATDDAADHVSSATKAGGAIASAGVATEVISSANQAKDSISTLPDLGAFVTSHASLIALVLIVAVVWWKRKAILWALSDICHSHRDDYREFRHTHVGR